MTFDPDRPVQEYGVPGYKRGSFGSGSIAAHRFGTGDLLDPEATADRYEHAYGWRNAIRVLNRDAGDPRYTHHFMRLAARLLIARGPRG